MARLETGLRRARLKSGLKQGELAERAGISRQTLSVLESGRGRPSTAVALQLARVLGCRVEELFWLREEGGELTAELAGGAEIHGGKAARASSSRSAGGKRPPGGMRPGVGGARGPRRGSLARPAAALDPRLQ